MAQTVSENTSTTNGTTAVDLVPVPTGSNVHVPGAGMVHNLDTVAAIVTLHKITSAGTFLLCVVTLQAGDSLRWEAGELSACNATDERWQVDLAGAVTTNELRFTISYLIVS